MFSREYSQKVEEESEIINCFLGVQKTRLKPTRRNSSSRGIYAKLLTQKFQSLFHSQTKTFYDLDGNGIIYF
jgi:hypothetical protein